MATISEMLALGQQHQRARDMAGAERIARQILLTDPANAAALHLLSESLQPMGRLAEAVEHYQNALRGNPTSTDLHNDLGIVWAMQGRLDEAVAAFQRALAHQPNNPDAHNNLGNAYRIQGRHEEAIVHFREAVQLKPNWADAHHNLGTTLLQQGNPEAAAFLQQAALIKSGRSHEALSSYQKVLPLKPSLAEAHNNLGMALCKLGLLDEGIASYKTALRLKLDYPNAYINLGSARKEQGQLDEAVDCCRRALRITPDAACHSGLLSTLLYHPRYDAAAIFEEQRRWVGQYARSLTPSSSFVNEPSPERRLRIGYISPDFRDHVVGRSIWPLLRSHDHGRFEITLYSNLARADALTEQFRRCADRWCDVVALSDDQSADKVRQDGIDILVDLALHGAGNRLLVMARKPAPVQVTFAGYPGSTGLAAIDYRLTDPYLDPPGLNDARNAEQSYRLPHSFWCYDPRTEQPAPGPLPALNNGFVTFGCLNDFCKINDGVLKLWAQVLGAVPGSRLLLLAHSGSHRRRTLDFLAQQGIAAERVEFSAFKPRNEYLALCHQVDIGLDTFPYNGHTTSLDSFWMGVPVITLVGTTVVGRAGLSQLTNLGLRELAAANTKDFVGLAVGLAGAWPRLQSLRGGLRERMKQSPLMDAAGFTRGIEDAYRAMWRTWCGQQKTRSG